ncbi:hypothetical protein UPYG_G00085270 [Umbra pygmaea]|uniref:Uncharacterized protein n=1 Tax=Umbra pygmaea TaxID=75934 RepID=A0ABD0XEL2_UMBPY
MTLKCCFKMDFCKEWDQEPLEVANVRNEEFEDTEWDQRCQLPDREHVDALLDISEGTMSKEEEPIQYVSLSGWDEAIQGWGRTTPLGCLVQTPARSKRVKPGDTEHQPHCLLCVDLVKLSEPHDSNITNSPESSCVSSLDPEEKYAPIVLGDFQNRASSHTCTVSSTKDFPAESIGDLLKATQQLMFQGKMVQEKCETSDTFAIVKGRSDTVVINSFAVLPPVKASRPRQQKITSQLMRGDPSLGFNAVPGVVTPAGESRHDAQKGEEMRATDDVVNKATVAEDTNQGSLTFKYCPTKQSHRLLSTFGLHVSETCHMSQSKLADRLPCATYPLGRTLRAQASSGLKTKNLRRPVPQLPVLLGTRVPMPATAQRILTPPYPSSVR